MNRRIGCCMILVLLCLWVCTSCNPRSDVSENSSPDSSTSSSTTTGQVKLIPPNIFAPIGDSDCHARIKITGTISGKKASSLIASANPLNSKPGEKNEYRIVLLQIVVDSLLPNESFNMGECYLEDDGKNRIKPIWSAGLDQLLKAQDYLDIRFTATGSINAFLVFLVKKDQPVSLVYDNPPPVIFQLP